MTYRNYSLKQLQQIDASHHLHPFTDHKDLRAAGSRMISRGEGPYVYDTEGGALLDAMAGLPAFVFGPRTEVVAWNAMGAALITDFAAIPREQRYYIRILVTDPAMRTLYADWEDVTRLAIAQMRMHNAANPADRQLAQVVEELSLRDPPVSAVVGGARRGRPRHRRQTSAAPDRR